MENTRGFSSSFLTLLVRTRLAMETDFKEGKKKKLFLWGKIVKTIKEKKPNINMTRQQLSRKFLNLLISYKRIKRRNNTTGRNTTRWAFYEDFDKVYGTTHSIMMPPKRLKLSLPYNGESIMPNYKNASVHKKPTPKHKNEEEHSRSSLNILEKTPNYNSDASVRNIPTPKHTNEKESTRPSLNILEKTVALLEGSQDDAHIYGKSWAAEYRQLDETQKLFAKRTIDEVLYQGRLRNLTSSSWHIQTQDNMEEY